MLLLPGSGVGQPLRLVADPWPPFTGATLEGGGLATAIVTTALERAGYSVQFEEAPWARALMGVGEGRYDVLVNAWYAPERTQIGQFSAAYFTNRIRFMRRRGSDVQFTGSLQGLHAYSIAVVRGYAYTAAFDSDPQLQKVPVQSFPAAVTMLLAGRVALAVEDESVARHLINQQGPALSNQVEMLDPPLAENSLHILVSLQRPDHEAIVTAFDQAITAMRADGSLGRLLKGYGL